MMFVEVSVQSDPSEFRNQYLNIFIWPKDSSCQSKQWSPHFWCVSPARWR